MGVTVPLERKLSGEAFSSLLRVFSLPEPQSVRFVDSSHGEDDLRHNYIIDNAYVLRANLQPVMTDARLCELNGLIDRYRAFGLLAPRFLPAADGHYTAEADGMHCYVSEYLDAPLADDKKATCRSALIAQRLELVCRFAARYRGEALSETRAMYSLFKLAPYDEPYGIDEKQSDFNDLTASLRESGERELAAALERRYGEIRARLYAVWDALPECFFQGDENFSNLCVDENGRIIGLFDFNMAGTDVIANYLANIAFQGNFFYTEERFTADTAPELFHAIMDSYAESTARIRALYPFTAEELDAYRLCAKIVVISGYVNTAAFSEFLSREETHAKTVELLRLILKDFLQEEDEP